MAFRKPSTQLFETNQDGAGQEFMHCERGVLQIRNVAGEDVWMVHSAATERWVVVHTTSCDVPLGCTASYPDNVEELKCQQHIRMKAPSWNPVVTQGQIDFLLGAAAQNAEATVARLVEGKRLPGQQDPRHLLLLVGPPGAGKTRWAQQEKAWRYDNCVHLCRDEIFHQQAGPLFRRLAQCREDAAPDDPFQHEAFLLESLELCHRFEACGRTVLWEGAGCVLRVALARGLCLSLKVHGDDASVEDATAAIAAARAEGYRVIGLYANKPPEVLLECCDARYRRELAEGRLMGGRFLGAMVDRLATCASARWPELRALCDETHELP